MLTRRSAFEAKYKTKQNKHLYKIIHKTDWTIVDIRSKISFEESHLIKSINIPAVIFRVIYAKHLASVKKILLISDSGRSCLEFYRLLKKHQKKVYILRDGWRGLHNKLKYDNLVVYTIETN